MIARRPLRVLVLLASTNRRGAEIEGERLTQQLCSIGSDATVAALTPGNAPALDVETLGPAPLSPATLRRLRHRVADVDVIVAYGSSTLPACAIALIGTETPFVYRSIGDPQAWVRNGLHRRRTGWMMRRASRVVALWPVARDAISQLYGVGADRIDVIPNARSRNEFGPATPEQRDAARATLHLPCDARVVTLVGSLSEEKRPGLAVDAVACLADAHLLVVGDGPLRQELEARAGGVAGERIHFVGPLPSLTEVYAATDVILSTSSTEGMSGVLIEAGMSGIPVCATNVGATGWLFDQGLQGTLVDPTATADEYAAGIEHTWSTPVTDRQLAGVGWEEVTAQWTTVLEQLRR